MLVDRETDRPTLMASTEGGVEIEQVAAETPEKILTSEHFHPADRPAKPYHARRIACRTKRWYQQARSLPQSADRFMRGLCRGVRRPRLPRSAEINPLVVTGQRATMLALDAKMSVRRQRPVPPFRSWPTCAIESEEERDPKSAPALRHGLSYVKAGRQYRLHGQRRRAGDGDHGHHQAARRRAGQLSRRRRRRRSPNG